MSFLAPLRRADRNLDYQESQGKRYIEWVQGLGCLICCLWEWRKFFSGEYSLPPRTVLGSEAAHIGGNSAAKPANVFCAPLCPLHHRYGKLSQEALKMDFFVRFGLEWPVIHGHLWVAFLTWDRVEFP